MVDLGGSLAVASMGLYSTGVSTDINSTLAPSPSTEIRLTCFHTVSYIRGGGKAGETIKAEAECDKLGGTMAFTRVTFYNSKGELAARGSHTKCVEERDMGLDCSEPQVGY